MARDIEDWEEWTCFPNQLCDIPTSARRALFYRERNSHRGIHQFQNLEKLKARVVNQDFLEEICELKNLKFLSLERVSAKDLKPLKKLNNLRTLKIETANQVIDFLCLSELTHLNALYLCNAKHLSSIEFLSESHHLARIGVEGSMWAQQRIETLEPSAGLKSLQEIFMSSVRLVDKNLTYLANCPKLEVFECARFAPKSSFEELRQLMPDLSCRWCDKYEID